MRAWLQQTILHVDRATESFAATQPPSTPSLSMSSPATPAPATPLLSMSSSPWTPMYIAEMAVRWSIVDDTSGNNVINVRRRQASGHVLAVRVKSEKGWRIMKDVTKAAKVILVPTNESRSFTHWILDVQKSKPNNVVWSRAGKVMTWIALPNLVRESTMIKRADRRVAVLSPAFSPPLRKTGGKCYKQNQGCACALGEKCQKLRLDAARLGKLPACDPRLCAYPSAKKVCTCVVVVVHLHTHCDTQTTTHTHTPPLPPRTPCMYACVHVCMHKYTHMHTCTHAHTHAHMHT